MKGVNLYNRGQQTFFYKEADESIFGPESYMFSVVTTRPRHCSVKVQR